MYAHGDTMSATLALKILWTQRRQSMCQSQIMECHKILCACWEIIRPPLKKILPLGDNSLITNATNGSTVIAPSIIMIKSHNNIAVKLTFGGQENFNLPYR